MTGPIGCRQAVEQLWDYLDHELDEADQRALDDHLAFCLRCCGELEFAREVRAKLAESSPAPPPEVRDRLEDFIDHLDIPGETPEGTPT